MKPVTRTVLGLVVLVGLVAFTANELRRDKVEGKRQVRDVLFPFGVGQVAELSFQLGDLKARYRRAPGGWQLIEGPAGADIASVSDFVGAWSHVRVLETVDEAPRDEDLARFGLKPPALVVRATMRSDVPLDNPAHPPALELGGTGPLKPSVYARVDGYPRVVFVSPDVLELSRGVGRRLVGLEPIAPPERDRHSGPRMAPAKG